jgi:Tol biopolymer transport system component
LCPQSLPVHYDTRSPTGRIFCSLTWSPGGKSLAFPFRERPDDPVGIFLLDVETREPQRLTTTSPGHSGDLIPAFSPDGRTIAFLRDGVLPARELWLVSLQSGELRQLTFDQVRIDGPAWTPDGKAILFSSPRGGVPRLWRIAAAGGAPEALTGVSEEPAYVAVSPRGRHLAYVKASTETKVRRLRRPGGSGERPEPVPFCLSTQEDVATHYSSDGRHVALYSSRSGSPEVWVCDSDGLNPRRLTSFGGPPVGSPRWSYDGKAIVFDSQASGNAAIWAVGVEDRKVQRLTAGKDDRLPSWSRDRQWVYFSSRRTGVEQIYRARADGGPETGLKRLSTRRGRVPWESVDGQWVYYYAPADSPAQTPHIWKVSPDGEREEHVLELPKGVAAKSWTLLEQGIYFLDADSAPGPAIRFFDLAGGQTSLVAQLGRNALEKLAEFAASPDGQWFLYTVRSDRREIMLVENFR